jgi:uncharacterized protein
MKQFVIPFSGLKAGNYQYSFDIEREFFDHFEFEEINEGRINVVVDLERKQRMLLFQFSLSGTLRVACDRCLDEFDMPVEGEERLIVKFGDESLEEADDIVIIREEDHQIDLGQYIYEYIKLLIPIKKVHPEDADGNSLCNPEFMKYISHSLEEEDKTDPRWDALRKLKKNN